MADPIETLPFADKSADNNEDPIATAESAETSKDALMSSEGVQSAQIKVQALTDRALHFLATASNETLGACLIGLGATTYFVLGRVGLVLIGIVGGVVLHATWEGNVHGGGDNKAQNQEARRREIGLDVVHRVLDWRRTLAETKDKSQEEDAAFDIKLYSGKNLDYSDFRPETAAALAELTEAVVRDYVKCVLPIL